MATVPNKPRDPLNPTLEEAAEIIAELIRDFGANEKYYFSASYSEAQVRKDFIDKLLIALGWDVNHDIQKNPYQQEVTVERAVQTAMAQRRADYSLSLMPHFESPVLYLEAKKPHDDIATVDNYFQTIRYANQQGHAIGILTSFAQLHVIDCRFLANIDTALQYGLQKYTYAELADPEKFRWIFYLISHPAIIGGSIARYAETLPKPKGRPGQKAFLPIAYKAIDDRLLETLDELRSDLARSLKNRNPQLESSELTELTQRILDRLVFIRFLEDKLIEPNPIIPTLGRSGGRCAWEDFLSTSRRLDGIYNGVVFRRHAILDDPGALVIDDKHFVDLLDGFDFHKSKYLFNEIPLYILGSIYERFLGNVIVATAKRATLEPKPEVRKAGGVYYTPKYIADYIVANTVGKLIADKSPAEIAKMRFADIACGSGSFLLAIYDCILKYVTSWYNEYPSKAPKGSVVTREGVLRLSLTEKSRILLDNIFGVDISPQAVEVAQLSLYLKLLEEETTASARQFTLDFHRPLLPSLANNIKCGNSLIGPDYYDGRQLDLLDPDTSGQVNAFDWKAEFQEIMRSGGFDAIVGNPPYVRMESFTAVKDYLRAKYASHEERSDLYSYFIERGIGLLSQTGLLGLIVSNKFVRAKYGKPLREFLAQRASVRSILDLAGANVFKGATVRTLVVIASPHDENAPASTYAPVPSVKEIAAFESGKLTVSRYSQSKSFALPADALSTNDWKLTCREASSLLDSLRERGTTLAEYIGSRALFGLKTGCNEAFVIAAEEARQLVSEDRSTAAGLLPILFGKDIRRYSTSYAGRQVIYMHPNRDIAAFPALHKYLEPFKRRLRDRAGSQAWYELQQPAVALLPFRNRAKIIYPIIANECRFTLDEEGYLINDKAFILPTDDRALLGVLNSRLGYFYFSSVCAALEGQTDRYLEFRAQYVDRFPVSKNLVFGSALHAKLISLVSNMLALHRQLPSANTDHSHTILLRQVDAIGREIDHKVYEMYGLTEAKIKIIEEVDAPPEQSVDETASQEKPIADEATHRSIRARKKVPQKKTKKRRAAVDKSGQKKIFD
ncbi:MAG: TaqI-like C-terminal specificity domain-containing protein [Planctomycetota bacterium]